MANQKDIATPKTKKVANVVLADSLAPKCNCQEVLGIERALSWLST